MQVGFSNKKTTHKPQQTGVSLIELMVAIAIIGILAAVALPAFSTLIRTNNITSYTNQYIAAINYARSEAIKNNRTVTICKSSDGDSCSTDNAVNWSHGWLIFIDLDSDNVFDTNETLLRVSEGWQTAANSQSYSLVGGNTSIGRRIRFNRMGARGSFGGTIFICPPTLDDEAVRQSMARGIAIGNGGRPKVIPVTSSTYSCPT